MVGETREKDKVALTLYISKEQHELLKKLSEFHGLKMSSLIRHLIVSEARRVGLV